MVYHLVSSDYFKTINDLAQGAIKLSWDELLLVDTCYLQRLKYISQMSYVFHVVPSAHHTRFEHSLGTMNIVKQMLETIEQKGEFNGGLNEVKKRLLTKVTGKPLDDDQAWAILQKMTIYAALLHDIGHGPFSHLTDEIFEVILSQAYENSCENRKKREGCADFLNPEKKLSRENFNDDLLYTLEEIINQYESLGHEKHGKLKDIIQVFIEKILVKDLGNQPHEVRSFYLTWSRSITKDDKDELKVQYGCLSSLLEKLIEVNLPEGSNSSSARKLLEILSTMYLKCNLETLTVAYFWIELWKKIYKDGKIEEITRQKCKEALEEAEKRARDHLRYLKPLHQLINGPLDADKMDYLLRDAYYSGIDYTKSKEATRILLAPRVICNNGEWVLTFDEYSKPAIVDLLWKRVMERTTLQAHHVNLYSLKLLTDSVQTALSEYAEKLHEKLSNKSKEQKHYKIIKTLLDTYRRIANQTDVEFIVFWPSIIPGLSIESLSNVLDKLVKKDLLDAQLRAKLRITHKRLFVMHCKNQYCKKDEHVRKEIQSTLQQCLNLEDQKGYIVLNTEKILEPELRGLISNITEKLCYYNRSNKRVENPKCLEKRRSEESNSHTYIVFIDASKLVEKISDLNKIKDCIEKNLNQYGEIIFWTKVKSYRQ